MLGLLANASTAFVGLLHCYIFNLEALTWYRGSAKGFGVKPEHFALTAGLAANQGFYNLVLAFGLFHALATGNWSNKVFFTAAVVACGIIGYITTGSGKILRAQCVPAGLALALLFAANKEYEVTSAAGVAAVLAATVAISKFVKARLDGDAIMHAKKLAGAK